MKTWILIPALALALATPVLAQEGGETRPNGTTDLYERLRQRRLQPPPPAPPARRTQPQAQPERREEAPTQPAPSQPRPEPSAQPARRTIPTPVSGVGTPVTGASYGLLVPTPIQPSDIKPGEEEPEGYWGIGLVTGGGATWTTGGDRFHAHSLYQLTQLSLFPPGASGTIDVLEGGRRTFYGWGAQAEFTYAAFKENMRGFGNSYCGNLYRGLLGPRLILADQAPHPDDWDEDMEEWLKHISLDWFIGDLQLGYSHQDGRSNTYRLHHFDEVVLKIAFQVGTTRTSINPVVQEVNRAMPDVRFVTSLFPYIALAGEWLQAWKTDRDSSFTRNGGRERGGGSTSGSLTLFGGLVQFIHNWAGFSESDLLGDVYLLGRVSTAKAAGQVYQFRGIDADKFTEWYEGGLGFSAELYEGLALSSIRFRANFLFGYNPDTKQHRDSVYVALEWLFAAGREYPFDDEGRVIRRKKKGNAFAPEIPMLELAWRQ